MKLGKKAMNYKKLLNQQQYQAVTSNAQYLRIIAGAGSGKTRVLTYRLAYLIGEKNINPQSIVAIAFTNKVANEMKERVSRILGGYASLISVSTFHSYCARFLRQEIYHLGYPSTFTILDEDDQNQIIKTIAVEFGLRKNDDIVKIATQYIATSKCQGKFPDDILIKSDDDQTTKDCYRFFVAYENYKNRTQSLDFDDLLLYSIKILKEFPEVREKRRKSITNILIDEFQDTNDVQYELVKLLMNDDTNLYVVGDPDQTIYTWRGANQNIILDLVKVFPNVETIILNENYRSSRQILDVANTLIKKNDKRVPKDLFTNNKEKGCVNTFLAFSKELEAHYVIDNIKNILKEHRDNNPTIAILYRAAYLTLPFEKELISNNIPYAIYGGVKFFERKEIKDVLAFFRLLFNEKDDISFERIINVPRRGIGEQSLRALREHCHEINQSIYEYIQSLDIDDVSVLKPRQTSLLKLLIKDLEKLKTKIKALDSDNCIPILESFLKEIGYYEIYEKNDDGERLENVITLLSDIRDFLKRNPGEGLNEYLQNVTLESAQDEIDDQNKVLLMTVHVAKGLEFDYVFVVNMVEGVFPSEKTMLEHGHDGLEEERRLCYVAFTRAKKALYVTSNQSYSFVLDSRSIPSRFFSEGGLKLAKRSNDSSLFSFNRFQDKRAFSFLKDDSGDDEIEEPVKNIRPTNGITDWKVGDICSHLTFGRGVVLEVDDDVLTINFDNVGRKLIRADHISLTKGGRA